MKDESYTFTDIGGREHHVERPLVIKEVEQYGDPQTLIMEADATHYALTIFKVKDTHNRHIGDPGSPQILIVGGVGRAGYCIAVKGYLSLEYLASKIKCSTTDAANIIHMLQEAGYRLPREAQLEIKPTK